MLINDFYANREVFVSGATGFLGKALIEKLLRDSQKLKTVYVMLRGKKSLSIEERLEQLKKDRVFERIHTQCPEVLNKLHAIQGDSGQLGLGISQSDLTQLQNVSIVFHMAANVRFDHPLRDSILTNTRGTYEMVKIVANLKNLVAFVHCSTAYCNPFEDIVEEKVYPMNVDWRKAIKIAETYDEYTLNALSYKYTNFYPNTYTFTKNLSEQLVQEHSNIIPTCIFRPSVVTNALREPSIGWIDNLNGPMSGLVAANVGLISILYCDGDLMLDIIPVDVVTKLTIVAAYKRGMQHLRKEYVPDGLDVVNCASGKIFNTSINTCVKLTRREADRNPLENTIWNFDDPMTTSCYYNFILQVLAMNVPLSILIDLISRFMKREPMMTKMTRRIVHSLKTVETHAFKVYDMINKNMLDLEGYIPQAELPIYGAKDDLLNMDIAESCVNAFNGLKHFVLNQPLQATAAAKKRAKILYIVSRSLKIFTITLLVLYLYSIVRKF